METELKPCPFCGSSNIELYKYNYWRIHCRDCGTEMSLLHYTPSGHEVRQEHLEEAIVKVWNRRSGDD